MPRVNQSDFKFNEYRRYFVPVYVFETTHAKEYREKKNNIDM